MLRLAVMAVDYAGADLVREIRNIHGENPPKNFGALVARVLIDRAKELARTSSHAEIDYGA